MTEVTPRDLNQAVGFCAVLADGVGERGLKRGQINLPQAVCLFNTDRTRKDPRRHQVVDPAEAELAEENALLSPVSAPQSRGSLQHVPENPSIFAPLSRRFPLLRGSEGLPISCLSCAPTAHNIGPTAANASNLQLAGGKEDRLESAPNSKNAQDQAEHLWFGC